MAQKHVPNHPNICPQQMVQICKNEAKLKHNWLCNELDGLITPAPFENIKRMAKTYLNPKTVEKANGMNELLHHLEVKGVLAVGKYNILIKLMEKAGIRIGIDVIKRTKKEIQNIIKSSTSQARVKKTNAKVVCAKHQISVKSSTNKRKSKGKAPVKGKVVTKKSVSLEPNTTRVKKTKEKVVCAKCQISVKSSANKRKSKGKAPVKGKVVQKQSVSLEPNTTRVKKTNAKVVCAKHQISVKSSTNKRKSKGKAPVKGKVVTKKSVSLEPNTNMSKSFSTPKTPQKEAYQTIASLTPSLIRWKIQARVTMKGDIATKRKKNSAGKYDKIKYFPFKVTDESGEIEGVVFGDAVDKFYKVLKLGKVFYISGATLKEVDKKFNPTTHDYNIVINKDACIKLCQDTGNISQYGEFDFTTIDKLQDSRPGELVDVIAVLKEYGESDTVKTKKRKNIVKREIQLVDQSGMQVGLTLWRNDAKMFSARGNPVLAFKRVKVSEWAGRSLTMLPNSQKFVNPSIPEAEELRLWFINKGRQMNFTGFS